MMISSIVPSSTYDWSKAGCNDFAGGGHGIHYNCFVFWIIICIIHYITYNFGYLLICYHSNEPPGHDRMYMLLCIAMVILFQFI